MRDNDSRSMWYWEKYLTEKSYAVENFCVLAWISFNIVSSIFLIGTYCTLVNRLLA